MSTSRTEPEASAVWEGAAPFLMARLIGYDGSNVVQSDIASITYTARNADDLDTEIEGDTLTVASVIFDTLQTDDRWSKDSTGYNFRHKLPKTAIPDGTDTCIVQYKFTDSNGDDFYLEFELYTRNNLFN